MDPLYSYSTYLVIRMKCGKPFLVDLLRTAINNLPLIGSRVFLVRLFNVQVLFLGLRGVQSSLRKFRAFYAGSKIDDSGIPIGPLLLPRGKGVSTKPDTGSLSFLEGILSYVCRR
jgi:hypothetical protein